MKAVRYTSSSVPGPWYEASRSPAGPGQRGKAPASGVTFDFFQRTVLIPATCRARSDSKRRRVDAWARPSRRLPGYSVAFASTAGSYAGRGGPYLKPVPFTSRW